MRKLLLIALAACSASKSPATHDAPLPPPDATIDAAADAAPHTVPIDGQGITCDPLAQTGCPAGDKCTWITDAPGVGHVGCATQGAAAIGAACTLPATGADNCVGGAYCISGRCESLCASDGSTPACDASHACGVYSGIFADPGQPNAVGLCDPQCDPLTQASGGSAACGSPDPANPALGCYTATFEAFTCAGTPEGRGVTTSLADRDACSVGAGCAFNDTSFFTNGCDPGFLPFFFDATGSSQVDCTALCAPLGTDATQPANAPGDATALGKLPADAAPVAGHATCTTRGKESGEDCRFLWPFLVDPNTGMPGTSPFNDTLGVCFAAQHFLYDPTGGSNPTKVEPSCATLRAGSAGDAGNDTTHACSNPTTGTEADCFAVFHGCYPSSQSFFTARPHAYIADHALMRRRGGIVSAR